VYSSLLTTAQKKRCEAVEDVDVGIHTPSRLLMEFGATISSTELYNSNRIVRFVYVILHDIVTVIQLCILYV
jgi:hypothetical protein